ncbi:hypothetical protein HUU05_04685 [candidate division KSB1 bacterium]|nr:hypothetical protein [candidate division KSB1 bacterium]
MPNTGRGVTMKKTICDDALRLDMTELRRLGLLQRTERHGIVLRWRRGEQVIARMYCALRSLSASAALLRLSYDISETSRESKGFDYEILLVKSKCYFGGVRDWFMCPLSKEGRPCGRRCRVLYLPHGAQYFGCRLCYELTYESRQRHRNRFYEGIAKPWDKRDKAREKLLRARKPKTMRKLAERIWQADMAIKQYCREQRMA